MRFAAAASAVAPGGTLLVLGHDSTNLTAGHGGPKDPAVLYTADDLVPELELAVERAGAVGARFRSGRRGRRDRCPRPRSQAALIAAV